MNGRRNLGRFGLGVSKSKKKQRPGDGSHRHYFFSQGSQRLITLIPGRDSNLKNHLVMIVRGGWILLALLRRYRLPRIYRCRERDSHAPVSVRHKLLPATENKESCRNDSADAATAVASINQALGRLVLTRLGSPGMDETSRQFHASTCACIWATFTSTTLWLVRTSYASNISEVSISLACSFL